MVMEVQNICKNYGKKAVLKSLCLRAEAGQCIGILGENGSGKSTLFGVLSGLLSGSGAFLLDGKDLMKDSALRAKKVGFVPQSPPLFTELTAWDNLRLWYSRQELEESLRNGNLKMLGVDAFLKVPVKNMSGGMKKRLAIACATSGSPEVLLLDEPTSALDLVCKEEIYAYLRSFQKKGGIVLLATHDVHELQLCHQIYTLKDGMLRAYTGRRLAEDLIGCLKDE